MKSGCKLIPLREGMQSCVIIEDPDPPKKWLVKYESGKYRRWSKTHLKKYYMVTH